MNVYEESSALLCISFLWEPSYEHDQLNQPFFNDILIELPLCEASA